MPCFSSALPQQGRSFLRSLFLIGFPHGIVPDTPKGRIMPCAFAFPSSHVRISRLYYTFPENIFVLFRFRFYFVILLWFNASMLAKTIAFFVLRNLHTYHKSNHKYLLHFCRTKKNFVAFCLLCLDISDIYHIMDLGLHFSEVTHI